MEIVVLGSGTGTPSLTRHAAGLLLKINNQHLLFDSGPGAVRQLLKVGITYHDLDHIFYTHFHTDHTLDLAAFLFAAKYALSLRTKRLVLYGSSGLERFYQGLLNVYGEVINPKAYEIEIKEIEEQTFRVGECRITTAYMQHTPQSLGYRIEVDNKVLVYAGDTDVCENVVKLGKDSDLLILECSFPDEMKVPGHLVAQEAAEIATAANCRRLMLTHLYPVCQEDEILHQAAKHFSGEIIVAKDLMKLSI